MSAPTNRGTIATALTAVLQSIDGTGSYTHNLSGADQVEQLDLNGPPVSRVRPYVAFFLGSRQDIRGGADADLSQYGQTMSVDLLAVVSGGTSPSSAVQAAQDMEADILLALHGSRTLGSAKVFDLAVNTDIVTGSEVDGRNRDAYVAVTIDLFWARV